jgi:DNA-binding XRE family transcriptional regulator
VRYPVLCDYPFDRTTERSKYLTPGLEGPGSCHVVQTYAFRAKELGERCRKNATYQVYPALWELFVAQTDHDDPSLLALGRAVQLIREQQGVGATELAEASGVSLERVEALEAGQLDPAYELLLNIADGLGARPSTLIVLAEQLQKSDNP